MSKVSPEVSRYMSKIGSKRTPARQAAIARNRKKAHARLRELWKDPAWRKKQLSRANRAGGRARADSVRKTPVV